MNQINDFTIMTNGINSNFEIIKHNETGFYNITKINNYIYDQKCKQFGPTAIAVGPKKLINDWTRRSNNQELIKELQNQLNTDDEMFLTITNVNVEFKGTYVHSFLVLT
jgi:hypothetical protein